MPAKKHTPVSRDLTRIIKEASKLEMGTLSEHVKEIENRQGREIEYYFRACVSRLDRAC
jgi:hypothetical protein